METTVNNFKLVKAYAASGHRPTADVKSIDYVFSKYGTWL